MRFTAIVFYIPHALTSTKGWILRQGGQLWNMLHRVIYVSAILAVIHYWWKVKLDTTNPRYYALLVAVLLGARIWRAIARRQSARAGQPSPVRT
jgi:sulfoxide reductase heme-binding subunit YedZ